MMMRAHSMHRWSVRSPSATSRSEDARRPALWAIETRLDTESYEMILEAIEDVERRAAARPARRISARARRLR